MQCRMCRATSFADRRRWLHEAAPNDAQRTVEAPDIGHKSSSEGSDRVSCFGTCAPAALTSRRPLLFPKERVPASYPPIPAEPGPAIPEPRPEGGRARHGSAPRSCGNRDKSRAGILARSPISLPAVVPTTNYLGRYWLSGTGTQSTAAAILTAGVRRGPITPRSPSVPPR
jgi:hypothetical protein